MSQTMGILIKLQTMVVLIKNAECFVSVCSKSQTMDVPQAKVSGFVVMSHQKMVIKSQAEIS